MPHYEDRGDEGIVYVPVDNIQGEKSLADGSTRFKFIGGPYHGMTFRVYPPYDTVWWPEGTTYELSPPLNIRKSNKWKYVHNPTLRNGMPRDDQ